MPFTPTQMDPETVIVSGVSQTQKDKYRDTAFMWKLKKGHRLAYLQNRSRIKRNLLSGNKVGEG